MDEAALRDVAVRVAEDLYVPALALEKRPTSAVGATGDGNRNGASSGSEAEDAVSGSADLVQQNVAAGAPPLDGGPGKPPASPARAQQSRSTSRHSASDAPTRVSFFGGSMHGRLALRTHRPSRGGVGEGERSAELSIGVPLPELHSACGESCSDASPPRKPGRAKTDDPGTRTPRAPSEAEAQLRRAVRLLPGVSALSRAMSGSRATEGAKEGTILWRGMGNMRVTERFMLLGGTEVRSLGHPACR
jgi:hypothetical protein